MNLRNKHGHTLAMVAAQNNQKAILKQCIDLGWPIPSTTRTTKGNTALHYAQMCVIRNWASTVLEARRGRARWSIGDGASAWINVESATEVADSALCFVSSVSAITARRRRAPGGHAACRAAGARQSSAGRAGTPRQLEYRRGRPARVGRFLPRSSASQKPSALRAKAARSARRRPPTPARTSSATYASQSERRAAPGTRQTS